MADDSSQQSELQEALLQRSRDEVEERHEASRHQQQQLIPYAPFDITQFLLSILSRCSIALVSAFKAVESSCLFCLATLGVPVQPRAPQSGGKLTLSLIQEERLEHLWARLGQTFQPEVPEHQQELRELWGVAFPGEPCTSLKKNERWKDMGWQGEDPSTDMRGAGLFGVQNLLFLARRYPSEFDRLLHKRTGQRADWEYPFAAAGMNLTFALADLLGLGHAGPPGAPRGPLPLDKMRRQPAFAGFVHLLAGDASCFEELYAAAYRLLDARWLLAGASYMQFNAVLKDTMAELGAALKARPATLEQLNARLRLPPVQPVVGADGDGVAAAPPPQQTVSDLIDLS